MTEQLLRLIKLAGQGRAETNGSRRAGVLFLGCPPVSVGQEAEVGAWLGEGRSAAWKAQGTDSSSKSETIDDGSLTD